MFQLPWKKACLTFFLLLMFFSAFVPAAYAENKGEEISGSSDGDTYFTVVTEPGAKKCYLEIRQKRGVMAREPNSFAGHFFTRKAKLYERYLVTVEKLVGYSVVSTEEYQTEVKTFRLDLAPGCIYRVKVTPLYVTWAKKMEDKSYALVNGHNNPYTLQLDFFDLDKEHSFLDTVVIDIQRTNWMPKGWIEPATWKIHSTKGIRSISPLDAWPEAPSSSTPVIEPEPAAPVTQPDLPEPDVPASLPDLPEPDPAVEPEPPAPAADSGLQEPKEPQDAVSGSISYDPDLAISKASSILDSVPKNGARGASYVSRVLRAGGLEKIQEKGAGDLIDHLNDPKSWGRSIGTVIVDPRYDQLRKGDVLACVCSKGSDASNYTNGHGKGKGLYYGLQNFIISEVGDDYVRVYSATEHRYNKMIRLSCNGGDLIVPCNKCGESKHAHWIAFSFADDIRINRVSGSDSPDKAEGWNHILDKNNPQSEGDWYYVSSGKHLIGWQEIDGRIYYFLPDGRMTSDITTIDGIPYYFMIHPFGEASKGSSPDFGYLCKGGFFNRYPGSLVFTDDKGTALAWDEYFAPGGRIYFEYAFKAYDILLETPDILSCTFYDVDGDGIKEFITLSGRSLDEMAYTFYRVDYSRGAYVRVGHEPGYENSLVSDPGTGHLLIELIHTGWQYVYEITYDGNAIHSREIAVHDSEDGGYLSFGDKVYEYSFAGPVDYYPETAESYPEEPAADLVQEPPKQAATSPILETCDFFSVTLPASWADRYIISIPDVGIVQFFNKANYDAGYGGLLFSVYATTRARTHMQLLDFSIERDFPLKNGAAEVGCKYLDAWENGLVFALYDGSYTFNQNDPVLSSDYWEMYREIGAVLGTFRLDKETVKGIGEYIGSIEQEHPDWPYYGKIYTGPLF
jgi:hypothetical protein